VIVRVPHPQRVLVFALRVGFHEPLVVRFVSRATALSVRGGGRIGGCFCSCRFKANPPRPEGAPGLDSETWERKPLPRLLLSPSGLVESAEDIDRAYLAARARSNEGVMIKAADSAYQPGRRGLAWMKLKRELATLDVVITGAEYGHGKRAGLLSDYTFAVRGQDFSSTGELLNVGKAYSGVTDAEIGELTIFLKAHTLSDLGHFRTVEPLIVLEVAFNNITRSERHSSGFALRFPRILRLRPDKPIAEIDTVARVEEIYQSQVDKPVEEVDKPAEGVTSTGRTD
jgi:DNA ligase-1